MTSIEVVVDEFTRESSPSKSYQKSIKSIYESDLDSRSPFDIKYKKIYVVRLCLPDNPGKVVGVGYATVHYPKTTRRFGQWHFGTNKYRELWIDYIWISDSYRGKGLGRRLMTELEKVLSTHAPDVIRPNIYLVSLKGTGDFYHKCGYHLIDTPDHNDDEDYPSSFKYGAYLGLWFGKSIGNPLEFPVDEVPDDIPLSNASDYGLRSLYRRYFSEPVPDLDFLIRFIEDDDYSQVTDELINQLNPYDADYYREQLGYYRMDHSIQQPQTQSEETKS